MVNVTFYKTSGHIYTGFELSGHAGYSDSGQDIVCAAVSALVINTINSIEQFTDDRTKCLFEEETGSIEFHFEQIPSHDALLLLNSLVLGLEQIENSKDYEPYIDIIFKEV